MSSGSADGFFRLTGRRFPPPTPSSSCFELERRTRVVDAELAKVAEVVVDGAGVETGGGGGLQSPDLSSEST